MNKHGAVLYVCILLCHGLLYSYPHPFILGYTPHPPWDEVGIDPGWAVSLLGNIQFTSTVTVIQSLVIARLGHINRPFFSLSHYTSTAGESILWLKYVDGVNMPLFSLLLLLAYYCTSQTIKKSRNKLPSCKLVARQQWKFYFCSTFCSNEMHTVPCGYSVI